MRSAHTARVARRERARKVFIVLNECLCGQQRVKDVHVDEYTLPASCNGKRENARSRRHPYCPWDLWKTWVN
jgi:hypothetical protein